MRLPGQLLALLSVSVSSTHRSSVINLNPLNVSISSFSSSSAAAADVTYVKAHINRGSAGNNVLDLEFSDTVTGSDFEDGITIGVGINGSTSDYTAIDKGETSSIGIVSDKYIRYTFNGTVSTFQGWNSGTSKGHNLQVVIDSSPLNVADVSAGAGNSREFENNSTVNLLDGLVEVWDLEDANAAINSANDMDENSHGPTYVSAKLGDGAQMSRTGPKYLSHADSSDFKFGETNFTWSFWVKFDSIGTYQYMISKYAWTGYGEYLFRIHNPSNEPQWQIVISESIKRATWDSAVAADTWYHMVGYYDTDNDLVAITLNANTTPVETTGVTGAVDDKSMAIAFGAPNDGNAGGAVAGIMDEIALHSKVLSTDEITDLYNEKDGTAHGKAYPYIPDS